MKEQDIKVALGGVQETLLLPLWGRAKEAEKRNPIVYDPYAREIIAKIDYDFSHVEAEPEMKNQQLQWAIRAYNFDVIIREFLERTSNPVVVNIGAGLDTTFQRTDNGSVLWFNIDLPDAVALRQKLIPDSDREMTIAKSVFDFAWMDDIGQQTKDRAMLFMAAGVLMYFTAPDVETLLRALASAYPSAHVVFDAISSRLWVALTNWAIMRKSGMGSSVLLKWHLKRASHLRKWVDTLRVVEEYSMFSRVPSTEGWSKPLIRDMKIANFLRVYNMMHVQL